MNLNINNINLQFHTCPEARQFSKEEEKEFFPEVGSDVLCIVVDEYGSLNFHILNFNFVYSSFKYLNGENNDPVRDGNGETYWNDLNDEELWYQNNKHCTQVKAWAYLPKTKIKNENIIFIM